MALPPSFAGQMSYNLSQQTIIESRKEAPLLRLLTSLGGWPVIMGDEWIPEAFDWQETIAKLRQYNNDILIAIW